VLGVACFSGCGRGDHELSRQASVPAEQTGNSTQAVTTPPSTSQFVILGERSVSILQNALVDGGFVGARATSTTGTLWSGATLLVHSQAHVDTTQTLFGSFVSLQQNALTGPISTDHLTSLAQAQHGAVTAFVSPPSLPALQPVSPGTAAITVNYSQTVTQAAGHYGAVTVREGGVLRLSGGVYDMASLTVRAQGHVEVLAPTQLRVAGAVAILENTVVGPTTAGLTAAALRVESSLTSSSATSTPYAVELRPQSVVRGLFLAPAGSVFIQQNVTATGAFLGKDVQVQSQAHVVFQDGFAGATCAASCDDGNPCTADACTGGTCTHTAATAGTSCSDGNLCNGQETCNAAGSCVAGAAPVLDDGTPAQPTPAAPRPA
jgi:hypothetical protein